MEEAVVEAMVLVALLALATILGGFMAYSSAMKAQSIQERNTQILALDILIEIGKACKEAADPDRPVGYEKIVATVSLTGREAVALEPWGIIVNAGGKARAVITKADLESYCSRLIGSQVTVEIVPGTIVDSTVSLAVSYNQDSGVVKIERAG